MGHSSIKVSLTYLIGLEIPELNEEDVPLIKKHRLILNISLLKKIQG